MMSKFVRKTTLGVLSLLFALCVSILGIHAGFSVNAEDTPTVVNLTFNTLGLNGGENNDNTFGGTNYYTCIRFTTGVFSGDANGVYDFSDLTGKASYVGSGNT
ncbi:MAG: hypothetical protein IKA99_05785, partial [Clostridia bacterium]|nr:hypothetical protein [Clostridia bacterium]